MRLGAAAVLIPAITVLAGVAGSGALSTLREGARTAAEAAALAAAGHLLNNPLDKAGAVAEAAAYARANAVLGRVPELGADDVLFDDEAASVEVRVRVPVIQIPALLRRIGMDDLVVTATAAAEGRAGGGLPIKALRLIESSAGQPSDR